jgi:hypothetical protein
MTPSKSIRHAIRELPGYAICDGAVLYRLGGGRSGRDVPRKSVTFGKAMQLVGSRSPVHMTPFPLLPGVWQFRFGGDVADGQFLGGKSADEFLRRHAFGPTRIHPPHWPLWPDEVEAEASRIVEDCSKVWSVLTHQTTDSERLREHAELLGTDVPPTSLMRSPVVLLLPVVLAAVRSRQTIDATETDATIETHTSVSR